MTANSILLVDDDKDYTQSLKRALIVKGIKENILTASTPLESIKILKSKSPNVAIVDLELDSSKGVESGYSLLKQILDEDKTCKVIILTGHSSSEYGIKAIKFGASNFLKKPADINHLIVLIKDAIEQSLMLREYENLKQDINQKNIENFIIGESDEIKQIRDEVLFLGQNNSPILIMGETGTGKGLIAKSIHLFGKYKDKQFVRYQPNYLSNDLTNSDFFGHKKGSFTGALEDKKGLLELSNNGTFFLDEVALLPIEIQIALLTTLQEHKIRRIGDTKEINVDFRLICATNEDINEAISDNRLRLDFYHRIAHSVIKLPPLRERKEDIKPLTLYFLNELSKKEDILIQDINKKALDKLKAHSFKGNIRELEAIIEVSAYKANFKNKRVIEEEDILFNENKILNNAKEKISNDNLENSILNDDSLSFKDKINKIKKSIIQNELKKYNDNQMQTAKALGIDRTTLIRILEK
ncbi:MAG: sigma-54 dependent transcriptional regulator [Bdellovibrionota bacterium]|nr:sigma-54 dependent transcriptional regulator [Pseudomonadota bacterium]MDY6090527.1 sigma-54 dependent transcriptional regulator [Bdellovibrionota bacterium]